MTLTTHFLIVPEVKDWSCIFTQRPTPTVDCSAHLQDCDVTCHRDEMYDISTKYRKWKGVYPHYVEANATNANIVTC
jgi:hypothetical protein